MGGGLAKSPISLHVTHSGHRWGLPTYSTLHREDKLRCRSESKLAFLHPFEKGFEEISLTLFICLLGEVSAATPIRANQLLFTPPLRINENNGDELLKVASLLLILLISVALY